jgi:hypothetical protein
MFNGMAQQIILIDTKPAIIEAKRLLVMFLFQQRKNIYKERLFSGLSSQ